MGMFTTPNESASNQTLSRRLFGAGVLATASLPAVAGSIGRPVASATPRPQVDTLPAPFDQWNVELTPERNNFQVLTMCFDSPLLGRRMTNTVYIPDHYTKTSAPLPVLYYLHGTIVAALQHAPGQPVYDLASLANQLGEGGGKVQTDLFRFDQAHERAEYIVVALDTDPNTTVFENSFWVDGRDDLIPNVPTVTAQALPAESHFLGEIIPLTEAVFRVRTDRGGRGVIGYSAGAGGALLQGFRHPDLFQSCVGVSSPADILAPIVLNTYVRPIGYLRDQGYGDPLTHQIFYRNFNPVELASNAARTDTTVIMSAGDGCADPRSLLSPSACRSYPAADSSDGPVKVGAEKVEMDLRYNSDSATRKFTEAGLDHIYLRVTGVHGGTNHPVYHNQLVDRLNTVFNSKSRTPESFDYRTVDRKFSIWNYDVSVDRSGDDFTSLRQARSDGRSWTVAGTGTARIVTPPAFDPGQTLQAVVKPTGGSPQANQVETDKNGRIQLEVPLSKESTRVEIHTT